MRRNASRSCGGIHAVSGVSHSVRADAALMEGRLTCTATDAVNTASASMINGGYVSDGAKVKHGMSRSSTITKDGTTRIKREELMTGRIDLTDVTTGKGSRPFTRGKFCVTIFWSP